MANRSSVPRLRVGTGNHFHFPGATEQSANYLHLQITNRLNAGARKALNPRVTQDDYGNWVYRVSNPGYTQAGTERETVDFFMGQGGFIGGHNTANPGSVFAVTGLANVQTGSVYSNIQTLTDLLSNAAGETHNRSIPSSMQQYGFPTLNVGQLTPQQQSKWGSAFFGMKGYGVGVNGTSYPIEAQPREIAGFSSPYVNPMYGGKSAHFFNADTFLHGGTVGGENNTFLWEKAKRFKNLNVPNARLERTIGIPEAQINMSMRLPGQRQTDTAYKTRMAFAMFGGGPMAEGQQYMREGEGYLATDKKHSIRLNEEQVQRFMQVAPNFAGNQQVNPNAYGDVAREMFGFGTGDLFRHRDVRLGGMAQGVNMREGLYRGIPGLDKAKAGSSLFSLIRDVQFDLEKRTLNVTVAGYTDVSDATSKWEKKAQNAPVGRYAINTPLDITDVSGNRMDVQAVQTMPSPIQAARLGLNSLRATYNEDQFKQMFMNFAESNYRIANNNLIQRGMEGYDQAKPINRMMAGKIWAREKGTLGGQLGTVAAGMGAAQFTRFMQVGFSRGTVTEEQLNTLNKSFTHNGQEYQRYSNPTALGNGQYEVDIADVYSVMDIGERYQKTYSKGRKMFKGAVLDNMAFSHAGNYEMLKRIQEVQGGNSALRFRQTVNANINPKLMEQVSSNRSIVNIEDLDLANVLGEIPSDDPGRQTKFMQALAKGDHRNSLVRMGNVLMPSPREALSTIVKGKDDRVVGNFGAAYFEAMEAHASLQTAQVVGDTDKAQENYNLSVKRAYAKAQELANSSSMVERSNAIEIQNTLGGPARAMPGLAANEILIGREDFYNMLGINKLPKGLRRKARSQVEHFRKTMPDYFTIGSLMDPNVKPDYQVANLVPVFPDEYMKRPGSQELPEMSGGRFFVSQTLAKAFGKDFDGDTIAAWANAAVSVGKKGLHWARSKVRPTTNERINEISALQLAEQETLTESMAYDSSEDYSRAARAAVQPGGEAWKTVEEITAGFAGQQASQASIGPTYNTGMRLVQGARLAGDSEAAAALGWVMQAGYQTATKEQVFNDPGFNRIAEIMYTGNYNWSTKGDMVSGYKHRNADGTEEFRHFKSSVRDAERYFPARDGKLASRNYEGGIGAFAEHIAEGFAMLGSSVGAEEYAAKVAPNLATAMIPSAYRNEKTHNIMTQALIKSQASGDWSGAMSVFKGIVGKTTGVTAAVFGKESGTRSAGMAPVGGMTVAKSLAKGLQLPGHNAASLRELASYGAQAKASLDIKKTGAGGVAHQKLAETLSPIINRHSLSVQAALGGVPPEIQSAPIAEQVSSAREIARQSRAEYFAGRGGLYNTKRAAGIRQGSGNYGYAEGLMAPEVVNEIVQSTVQDIREAYPEFRNVPVTMEGLNDPEHRRAANGFEAILLPNEERLASFVAGGMNRREFRERMAGIARVHPDDLTHEQALRAIVAHETGHSWALRQQDAMGTTDEYMEMRARQDELHRQGKMPYGAIQGEQDADYFGSYLYPSPQSSSAPQNQLSSLRDVAKHLFGSIRQGAMGKKPRGRIVGMKRPYNASQQASQPGPTSVNDEWVQAVRDAKEIPFESPDPEKVQEFKQAASKAQPSQGASSGGGGGSIHNTNIERQEITNNITNRNFAPTNRADVDNLYSFINSGSMQMLQGYMDVIGSGGVDKLTQKQRKDFLNLIKQQRAAAKAADSYNIEAQDPSKRMSIGGRAVEGIFATGDNYEQWKNIEDSADTLRRYKMEATAAYEQGLPDKYRVSGREMAKGGAGVSGIEATGNLKELAAAVKDVTSVTKEQYASMKNLTKQYDAAEQIITKLNDRQQRGFELSESQQDLLERAKSTVAKNKGDLDTIRDTFGLAAMGGVSVQGDPMSQEERQLRLMQAVSQGGIGGKRARLKAKQMGLYGKMGEEGDEGGLDYLGRTFTSEGSINAIGGMIRLGNRASAVLHGMTHLTHNIINPIAAEVEQYGQTQLSRSQMMYGIMGGMTGVGNQNLQRIGGLNIARETASQQVYNSYAGIAQAFGGQQSGMIQGMAQSIAAPALSAAVGMQAIGAGIYAGPMALGVGAFAAGAWLSGAAGDKQQIASSVREINAQNRWGSATNLLNAPNQAVAAAGLIFNPEGSKQAEGIVRAQEAFSEWTTGRHIEAAIPATYSIGLNGWYQKSTGKAGVNVASQYNGMSLSQMMTGAGKTLRGMGVNVTDADVGLGMYQDYIKGQGAGLSEQQQQSAFGFVGRYAGSQSAAMLRDITQGFKNGRTDITDSIAAQVAATGGSVFNPNATDAGYINNEVGFAAWTAKGRAPGAYDQFVKENAQWAGQANVINRYAYGSSGAAGGLILADDDRYINNPWKKDLDIQARTSALSAAQTNVGAFRGGYGASSMAKRQSFVDNLDAVGLGVFNQNEQLGLGYSLSMQSRMGGAGLSSAQLLQTAGLSQVGGATLNNLLSGDAWTTSRLAGKLGNIGLATVDTRTGLGATQYGVSGAQLQAFQAADKLGLLKGVTAADVAGGTEGIQRNMELAQRGMQMFQFQQGQMQRGVQAGLMTGGGTIGANGMVQGGNLNSVAAIFAQNGMKFNAGNGMTYWQLEDAGVNINRQQQQFSMSQQGQQMKLAVQQFNYGNQAWSENYALNQQQFAYNTNYQRGQMAIDRSHQVTQFGWQEQDLQYSRNMSSLQFGFQMRDADRNIRYSRGRERIDLMRQRDDAVILHAAEMGQQDKQEDRLKKQEKWADQQFQRDKDHFEKTTEFQKKQMELDKKHHDQEVKFSQQSLQMQQEAYQRSVQWMTQEWKLEDQRRLLDRQNEVLQINMANEAAVKQQQLQVQMNRSQDILSGIAQAQSAILAQWMADLQTAAGYQKAVNASDGGSAPAPKFNPKYTVTQNWNGGYIGFEAGGFTGFGDKRAVRGVVHGGEYVVPQEGVPVVRGDSPESLSVLKLIAAILERIEKNPAVVNAVINTNQDRFAMKNLSLTDLAHGNVH